MGATLLTNFQNPAIASVSDFGQKITPDPAGQPLDKGHNQSPELIAGSPQFPYAIKDTAMFVRTDKRFYQSTQNTREIIEKQDANWAYLESVHFILILSNTFHKV